MKKSVVVLSLALVLIAGCAVGPDYQRPGISTPAGFRGDTNGVASTNSFADLGWWEVFEDPTLRQLIGLALTNNKDVRLAAARIEESRAEFKIARAELFPFLSGNAAYERNRTSELGSPPSPSSVKNPSDRFSLEGGVSYELDFWGRIRRLSEAARAQLLASEASRQTVMSSLVADVATAWLNLRDLDTQLDIARRTLASREKSQQLVESRHAQGVVGRLDVRQSEVLVATAARAIPDVEQAIAITENRLSLLLGQNPGDIPRSPSLTHFAVRADVPAGLPSQLLERRPDLRQAEQQLVAANAEIGAAKAAFFPQVTLTGNYGQISAEVSDLFKGAANTWSFAPHITVPIFTGGQLSGQYEASKARRDAALITYEQAIQSAFADVANALITRTKSCESREQQEKLTAALRDAAGLANDRYRGGVTSYLEVLDTERQLFDAERALAQARRDELLAVVQIYLALGGGWQLDGPNERHTTKQKEN